MQHIQKRLFSDFPKSPVQTQKRARNYSAITFKLQSNKQARYFSTTQLFKARTVKTDWVLGEITPPEPGAFPSFPEVAHGWAAAGWRSGGGTFPPRQYRLVLAHAFPPTTAQPPFRVGIKTNAHTRRRGRSMCGVYGDGAKQPRSLRGYVGFGWWSCAKGGWLGVGGFSLSNVSRVGFYGLAFVVMICFLPEILYMKIVLVGAYRVV